jgi:hypothetical protein
MSNQSLGTRPRTTLGNNPLVLLPKTLAENHDLAQRNEVVGSSSTPRPCWRDAAVPGIHRGST